MECNIILPLHPCETKQRFIYPQALESCQSESKMRRSIRIQDYHLLRNLKRISEQNKKRVDRADVPDLRARET